MTPLSSARPSVLIWSKIPHSRDYALTLNGEILGRLNRPRPWCSNFVAETKGRSWNIRRGGIFGAEAEIVDSASNKRIAQFKARWGKGVLTFADGQKFRVESKGAFRPVWKVFSESDQPILELQGKDKTVELRGNATAIGDERLIVLIMFLWYRKLQTEEDAAAAVAVIAAS